MVETSWKMTMWMRDENVVLYTEKYPEILMLKYIKFMYKTLIRRGYEVTRHFCLISDAEIMHTTKRAHIYKRSQTSYLKGQKNFTSCRIQSVNFFQQLIMFACFNSHQKKISDIWFTFWYIPSTMTSIWL